VTTRDIGRQTWTLATLGIAGTAIQLDVGLGVLEHDRSVSGAHRAAPRGRTGAAVGKRHPPAVEASLEGEEAVLPEPTPPAPAKDTFEGTKRRLEG